MKMKYMLLCLLSVAFLFSACNKNSDETDTVWKEANEAAFAKITANSEYTKLESQSKNGFVMYKVLKQGTGTQKPIFSDQVKVYYQGWYKSDWTKGDTYVDSDGNYIANKIVFDKSLVTPATLSLSSVVDGFATALQYMVVGDKWEIYIPWKLGYGSSKTSSGIPGYTTLVFEIELKEIVGN